MGQAQTKKNKKKNKRKFDADEEYFIKNGAILLEKQIALSQSQKIGAQQLKIISALELEKATNSYDPDLIVRYFNGGHVYKGTLNDRTVAVKTPKEIKPDSRLIDIFLTEAAMGMVMSHRNIAKLYGCCLETYIPILIYEFLPNNHLHKHLHGDTAFLKPLKWSDRLRAATDTAYALSYLHNALPKPVVHRDVVSFWILLDFSFHAKLASFGYSVSITPGQADRKLPVHGTPGYMDPEYAETKKVTEKCDVYSFGVLLLELLTGRDPIKMARRGIELVDLFLSVVKRNCMLGMIDSNVLEEGKIGEIQRVAQLALTCVANKGKESPTMIDIVNELQWIQCQND